MHLVKNETLKDSKGLSKPSAPKKFVFDFVETQRAQPRESFKSARTGPLLKFIPFVHRFAEPENYQEAYHHISQYIIEAYNQVRELFIEDSLESLKEAVKNLRVDTPRSCVSFIKLVAVKYFEKVRELNQKGDISKIIAEYEDLLQQSELKIRNLIRNEQIYRISFDHFVFKHEESEKAVIQLQNQLRENKAAIESLMQENSRYKLALRQKEEEVFSLVQEKENPLRNYSSNQSSLKEIVKNDNVRKSANLTAKVTNLDFNNIKLLLNLSRSPSTEDSKPASVIDPIMKAASQMKRKSKTPGISSDRSFQKSGTAVELGHSNNRLSEINGIERLREIQDTLKEHIGAFTERKKINTSGDFASAGSDRLSEWYGFVKSLKRPSSQLGHTRDDTKSKSHTKTKKKRERSEGDKSFVPGKFRLFEDLSNFLTKTEVSDDYATSSMFTDRIENKKPGDADQKPTSKTIKSPNFKKSAKRKSFEKHSSPSQNNFPGASQEKPFETKKAYRSEKQTESLISTFRKVVKANPLTERKQNKNNKSTTYFSNSTVKKVLETRPNGKK